MAQEPEEDFEGDGEPEFEAPSGGGKKKLLLFVALPLLLVIGGGAVAYFTGLADPIVAMITGKKPADASADAGDMGKDKNAVGKATGKDSGMKDAKGADAGKPGAPSDANAAVFYDLPEMLVNMNAPGHKRTFLKLRVSLELNAVDDTNTVENVLPRIIDSFQVYLREMRPEDLQGAAGIYRLRAELLMRVNTAVSPVQVKDVLFKDFIVQ